MYNSELCDTHNKNVCVSAVAKRTRRRAGAERDMQNRPEYGGRVQTARADAATVRLLVSLMQLTLARGLPADLLTAEGCPGHRGQKCRCRPSAMAARTSTATRRTAGRRAAHRL